MSIIFTLGAIYLVQITLFRFYRISSLITGIIFALMFGEFSLKLVNFEAIPTEILNIVIFATLFYLSLMKPNGEFFKKYIWEYKTYLMIPAILTLVAVFTSSMFVDFDLNIAIILILVLGVISLSTNSLAVDFFKSHNLEKEKVSKLFFAKAMIHNISIVLFFTTLLAIFDTGSISVLDISAVFGQVLGFLVFAIAFSRYAYPFITTKLKLRNNYLILLALLGNALFLSCIANFIGLNFIIGVFLSSILIPEKFLKITIIEPIRKTVGTINNYIFIPIFGLIIGLNLDVSILFDYDLFIPFVVLAFTTLSAQAIFSSISFRMMSLKKIDRLILLFGSFVKAELSFIILLMSLNYGIIDGDIFTSSIILIAMLNLFVWYSLNSLKMEKN